MTTLGTPNLGKIMVLNILVTTFAFFVGLACFHPLRNVVTCHQYVFFLEVWWEWSHEINPPTIKHFYLQNEVLRHLIPLTDAPLALA